MAINRFLWLDKLICLIRVPKKLISHPQSPVRVSDFWLAFLVNFCASPSLRGVVLPRRSNPQSRKARFLRAFALKIVFKNSNHSFFNYGLPRDFLQKPLAMTEIHKNLQIYKFLSKN